MNLFGDDVGAEGYESRPYFHPLVFERVARVIPSGGVDWGLDLGCGTGQSTTAMAALSNRVVGVDSSAAMLRRARGVGRIRYVQGAAERLPFGDAQFDLVGAGLASHWLDRSLALAEIGRVLKLGRGLVIFKSGFRGTMQENSRFADHHAAYVEKFPAPPRNSTPLSAAAAGEFGCREMMSEPFSHHETYTCEKLIDYLTTQTNVTAAVRAGAETPESVKEWLRQIFGPLFLAERATFAYGGVLSLFEKVF